MLICRLESPDIQININCGERKQCVIVHSLIVQGWVCKFYSDICSGNILLRYLQWKYFTQISAEEIFYSDIFSGNILLRYLQRKYFTKISTEEIFFLILFLLQFFGLQQLSCKIQNEAYKCII